MKSHSMKIQRKNIFLQRLIVTAKMIYQEVYQVTLCLSAEMQKEAARIGLKRSWQIKSNYIAIHHAPCSFHMH